MKFTCKMFCAVGALGFSLVCSPSSFAAVQSGAGQTGAGAQSAAGQTAAGAQSAAGQTAAGAQSAADQTMDSGSQKMAKSADTAFAMKAAQGGLAEVQLGKLAAEKAGSQQVKAFGQRMVGDHSKANEQLMTLAGKENMTLPTTLNAKDQALYTKLQNMSGPDFDKTYVKAMVKDHEEDIKEFKKESEHGKNDQLKSFASTTLPVLQSHLDMIKGIQTSMKSGGGAAASGM